jgi:hypothetical protein
VFTSHGGFRAGPGPNRAPSRVAELEQCRGEWNGLIHSGWHAISGPRCWQVANGTSPARGPRSQHGPESRRRRGQQRGPGPPTGGGPGLAPAPRSGRHSQQRAELRLRALSLAGWQRQRQPRPAGQRRAGRGNGPSRGRRNDGNVPFLFAHPGETSEAGLSLRLTATQSPGGFTGVFRCKDRRPSTFAARRQARSAQRAPLSCSTPNSGTSPQYTRCLPHAPARSARCSKGPQYRPGRRPRRFAASTPSQSRRGASSTRCPPRARP